MYFLAVKQTQTYQNQNDQKKDLTSDHPCNYSALSKHEKQLCKSIVGSFEKKFICIKVYKDIDMYNIYNTMKL